MKRLLITGSREWNNRDVMREALKTAYHDLGSLNHVILVTGNAKGADKMAEDIWEINVHADWIERHPAKDFPHPLKRNDHMVSLGADLCLAFPTDCHKVNCPKYQRGEPLHLSHGTQYTIDKAQAAGIDTRVFMG